MEVKLRLTRMRVVVLVALAAGVGAGVAYATIPDGNKVFTAHQHVPLDEPADRSGDRLDRDWAGVDRGERRQLGGVDLGCLRHRRTLGDKRSHSARPAAGSSRTAATCASAEESAATCRSFAYSYGL
jgi:hypothetical protein